MYIGKTSPTLRARSSQDKDDYRKASQNQEEPEGSNFTLDSNKLCHGDNIIDCQKVYKFSVVKRHKDPMSKQPAKGIRIKEVLYKNKHYNPNVSKLSINCRNRKGEHFKARKRFTENYLT